MADNTARFVVQLDSSGMTGPAANAAKAMEKLKASIASDTKALGEMQKAVRQMKTGGSPVDPRIMKEMGDRIAIVKSRLASSQTQFIQAGGKFGEMKTGANGAAKGMGKASLAVSAFATAAVLALYAAAGAAIAYGLAAADAARSLGLLFRASSGGAAGAKAVEASVRSLRKQVALSDEDLNGMALSLSRAGLAGSQLDNTLAAMAITKSTMGDGAAATIEGLIKAGKRSQRLIASRYSFEGTGITLNDVASQLAKSMKTSVGQARLALQQGQVSLTVGADAIRKAVDAKLGGIAKKQLLGFGAQLTKARGDFTRLFDGIKIEPLLEALASVLHLLDDSTASGQGLKAVAQGILQPLIEGAVFLAPYLKGMFKGGIIAALQFTLAMLDVRDKLRESFGGGDDSTSTALQKIETGFRLAGTAATLLGGAIKLAFENNPIVAAVSTLSGFISTILKAKAAFSREKNGGWMSMGEALMDGLIEGIQSRIGKVVSVVSGIAKTIKGTFSDEAEIKSPSRVMRRLGRFMTAGLSVGMEDGTPQVEAASRALVSIPSSVPQIESRSSSSSSITFNITINGVNGAESLKEQSFLDRLTDAICDAALESGAMGATS